MTLSLTVFSLMMSVSACTDPTTVDPQFQSYMDSFTTLTAKSTSGVNAVFGALQAPTLGECDYGTSTITIDPGVWSRASIYQREELMYHELGHCVLGLDHSTGKLSDGCPDSIMDEYTIPIRCYAKHRAEYLQVLKDAAQVAE